MVRNAVYTTFLNTIDGNVVSTLMTTHLRRPCSRARPLFGILPN